MIWLISALAAFSFALLAWVAAEALVTASPARQGLPGMARLEQQLAAVFLFVDARKLFWMNVAVVLLAATMTWAITASLSLSLMSLLLALFVPRLVYGRIRHQRQQKFATQLPDAIMTLSGALKAGASLNTGLIQLAREAHPPLSQEIELIVREQRLGVPLDNALGNLAHRMPLPSVILLVSTIRIAAETGGELAEALARTAATLRSIAQAEGKIAALTAQGRMQAWVVGLLPVLLMYVLTRMEPEAMAKLWTTPLGWGALAIMGFLEVMGIWLIRRIVDIDV